MVDDLSGDLPAAYQPPARWTPEHVMHRMIEAFDTLARLPGRSGPGGYGRGWPSYAHEYADILAQEEAEAADARRQRTRTRHVTLPPGTFHVSLMEEAFMWPARYLGQIASRVALVDWARRRSRGREDADKTVIGKVVLESTIVARGLRRDRVLVR